MTLLKTLKSNILISNVLPRLDADARKMASLKKCFLQEVTFAIDIPKAFPTVLAKLNPS